MEEIVHSGFWWLPSNPENKVAGIITLSHDDGIELRLIGLLEDKKEGFNNFPHQHEVILGVTEGSKWITLYNCWGTSFRLGFPGFASQSYKAELCFIGAQLLEVNQLLFSKLTLQYSHLSDWARTSGFTMTIYDNEPHRRDFGYKLPEDLKVITNKGTVSLTFTFDAKGDAIEKLNLHQSVLLEVEADKEYAFDDLMMRYIRPFQNFFTLATTKPNSITAVNVYSKHIYYEKSDGSGRVETPIGVFFKQLQRENKGDKLLIPDDMLFTFHDIADEFQSIIGRWLEIADELDSVCNLFFGVRYNRRMYSEQVFLNVAQAAESYHRRRMRNYVLPKAEHKARKRAILSQVSEDYREWLQELLNYSNEPRLEQRIIELAEKVSGILSSYLGDKEAFAKQVKDTRNYYTHFNERLEDKAAQGSDLYILAEKLSYLLQVCFLFELGFSEEKARQLIHRNQTFIQAMNRA